MEPLLSAGMTAAYIYGQHKDEDAAHFRCDKDHVYAGDIFDYHHIPFKVTLKAGTAMIMPHYGITVDQPGENVEMSSIKIKLSLTIP